MNRQLAKPDKFEVLGTDGLDEGPVADDAPEPRYYLRYTEPTFRCELCNEIFKLKFIRYHRPVALKPEQLVCSFCYDDKGLASINTQPASGQPSSSQHVASLVKHSTPAEKATAATKLLSEHFGTTAPGHTATELEVAIEKYVTWTITAGKHGAIYLELFFDRDDRLFTPDLLIQDFMDSQPDANDDQELEEFEWEWE